jgi:hypothetical protein
MEGYFGGWSGVKIRHKIVECLLADFRSQYPSVNALMKLQDLLIAMSVKVIRGTDTDAKRWLETVEINDLQRKETWPRLRGFARIRPDSDILPFRSTYESDESERLKSINVGVSSIHSAADGWWSFACIVASKIRTGKCPEILETIEFVPSEEKQDTNVIKIFGDPNYTVDLKKDDLFVKVIELRGTIQRKMADLEKGTAEYDRLDAMQLALKLLANATSYGALVEVIVDERATKVPCMVYHGGKATRRVARKSILTLSKGDAEFAPGFKVEKPGEFFAPYGGLIPAAGRLLLAIAEVLFRERGISFAYNDTDSMAPARPEGMTREEFRRRVLEVAGPDGWFQALSPYGDKKPFFALEDARAYRRACRQG